MRRRKLLVCAWLLPLAFGAPSVAVAQDTVGEVVGFLMTNQAVPTGDVERDRAAAEGARDTISRALVVNLTSGPIATSSSGFLYRLNPQLGTVERATESFGGFFIERALTSGRGHQSLGVSTTTSAFDRLDGRNLRDGSLVTLANRFRDEAAPFETDTLTLRIRTSTLTLFGSFGVTDRLELGAAVPFVRLTLQGERVTVYRATTSLQASGNASASGIADVAVRGKYTILAGRSGGVAAAAEVRFPTGDDRNLLGTGSASYRLVGIGSFEQGRLSLHGNAAVLRGGISAEWSADGGVSVAVRPRLTLSAEVLTRRLSQLHDMDLVAAPHPGIPGADTLRLSPGASPTTLSQAVTGLKWNITRTMVLGGHVAWALVHRGLTTAATPTLALEYAF